MLVRESSAGRALLSLPRRSQAQGDARAGHLLDARRQAQRRAEEGHQPDGKQGARRSHAERAGWQFATGKAHAGLDAVTSAVRGVLSHRRTWLTAAWLISALSCALLFSV